jgi:hypothetical protein
LKKGSGRKALIDRVATL